MPLWAYHISPFLLALLMVTVIETFALFGLSLSRRYFRAGENWKAGLARAIDVADVFQLFWSKDSATSEYCRYE